MKKELEYYFKTYEDASECFETSDGLIFHRKGDAFQHGNSLEDKQVKTHLRNGEATVAEPVVVNTPEGDATQNHTTQKEIEAVKKAEKLAEAAKPPVVPKPQAVPKPEALPKPATKKANAPKKQ